jgi:hypothetical protein
MTNPGMSNWVRTQGKRTRMCETYNPSGSHYCTRQVQHTGRHAYGNGSSIVQSWDR